MARDAVHSADGRGFSRAPSTPRFLDALDELGVRATFFALGEHVARHPALVRETTRRGHALGGTAAAVRPGARWPPVRCARRRRPVPGRPTSARDSWTSGTSLTCCPARLLTGVSGAGVSPCRRHPARTRPTPVRRPVSGPARRCPPRSARRRPPPAASAAPDGRSRRTAPSRGRRW
ncbi:hypothetical protein AV521_02235 [Streptomyces sp. IMTB 2501]|nr:hypothetical protein AV521_02235 [Streptomyces sp. IMTB 2501]